MFPPLLRLSFLLDLSLIVRQTDRFTQVTRSRRQTSSRAKGGRVKRQKKGDCDVSLSHALCPCFSVCE